MRSLSEIGADRYSDKGYAHRYWEVYDLLLHRHRLSAVRVLELGVYQGESMAVWTEAFPNAEIHGVDITAPPRTTGILHVGDAYSEGMLRELPDTFDVIVDDGPHILDSMLFTANRYTRRLAPGGTLVIEDVPDQSWLPRLAAVVPEPLQRFVCAVDRRMIPLVTDDSLLFVVASWT